MERKRVIFLADMESFYASVEVANNPALINKPIAVCGDPALRHGIVLAASPEAKAFGIKTGQPAWEARRMCPWIIFVHPRMQAYIDCSLAITKIFDKYTDQVVPYSIDEQFLDLSGSPLLSKPPQKIAMTIIKEVWKKTGIRCRVGAGENPLQAKMACDNFAKKNKEGFFELNKVIYADHVWPLKIGALFGIGHRLEKHFHRMGVRKIGQLAKLPRMLMARRWGVNGEILWLNANGIDYSIISSMPKNTQKGIGHTATLPRDYFNQKEIELVLLEMTEEVCFRTRKHGKISTTVHLYCRGADFNCPTGFSRQRKLPEPSAVTGKVYPTVLNLFRNFWDYNPVRAVGISLTGLTNYQQLKLLTNKSEEREMQLSKTIDLLHEKHGKTSLFRASSLKPGSQLFQRANRIGGHDA